MSSGFVVTGTDTGIGKTVASAMLTVGLGASYWKPVQSGLDGESDTDAVRRMTGLPDEFFLPEKYRLTQPLSPHRSAELDGIEIDTASLRAIPRTPRRLIIEGAGGLMVPLSRDVLYIDLFVQWQWPVVLCARTGLGTINHTLLSVDALKKRSILIHGILFIGDENSDTQRTICEFSGVKILGRLPVMDKMDAGTLRKSFNENFMPGDFG